MKSKKYIVLVIIIIILIAIVETYFYYINQNKNTIISEKVSKVAITIPDENNDDDIPTYKYSDFIYCLSKEPSLYI